MSINQRITAGSAVERKWIGQGRAALAATLPKGFFIESSFSCMSPIMQGNLYVENWITDFGVSVKKSFAKDRFTVSATVDNLFQQENVILAKQTEFLRRTLMNDQNHTPRFVFSLRYNFKSGVKFRNRSVEKIMPLAESYSASTTSCFVLIFMAMFFASRSSRAPLMASSL